MEGESMDKKPLSIVYSVTSKCPYKCAFCVMSGGEPDYKKELSFDEKVKVINRLIELNHHRDVRCDFSGGEPLSDIRNLDLISMLADAIGQKNVSATLSGAFLSDYVCEKLKKCVDSVEISLDTIPSKDYHLREFSNQVNALKAIMLLKKHGIKVGASTVLTQLLLKPIQFSAFYQFLVELSVDYWSILRLMPVGKAINYPELFITEEEWIKCRIYIDELCSKDRPADLSVNYHYTFSGHKRHEPLCRCVKKSIGILPDGTVTSCFWGIDERRAPLFPQFFLGNTPQESLMDIISNSKSSYWLNAEHRCVLLQK